MGENEAQCASAGFWDLTRSFDIVSLINAAMPDDRPILDPQNFANADQDDLEELLGMLLGE